jgi:hypothetical protein
MWKRNDDDRHTPTYSIGDLHKEIGESISRAKEARIHPVLIERALNSAADSFAQHRAMTESAL